METLPKRFYKSVLITLWLPNASNNSLQREYSYGKRMFILYRNEKIDQRI